MIAVTKAIGKSTGMYFKTASGGCYFLAVYRWSKAIEYFLRFVFLNTFFAELNILCCNLQNISDVVLNISVIIEYKTVY
jgi:hypothetical protein